MILPFRRSSSSSSAKPHEQFLHALFRRGAEPFTGAHAMGLTLSSGVKRDSGSIVGVEGAVKLHKAFFERISEDDDEKETGFRALAFLREIDIPGAKEGFRAVIIAFVIEIEVNPVRVRSETKFRDALSASTTYKDPEGIKADKIAEKSEEFAERLRKSVEDKTT